MADHDPLARRMIPCPEAEPNGCIPFHKGECQCANGLIPEPAEVWSKRLAKMCNYLATPVIHPENRYPDYLDTVEKGRIARQLAAEKEVENG
jgi:hypothetical protein